MRRRITALLLGLALLTTTFALGQQTATAEPSVSSQDTTVSIRTGGFWGSGTDARVFIALFGTSATYTGELPDTTTGPNLERDTTTTYHLPTGNLGDIGTVAVFRYDDRGDHPEWYLGSVTAKGKIFNFSRWIPVRTWCYSPDKPGTCLE
jgi:hypothetical protein